MYNIDVFDFDKTIYMGDSTLDFYIYCLKNNLLLFRFFPKQFMYFIYYKFGKKSKLEFKQVFFSFLKGIKNVDEIIEKFWEKNFKKINMEIINRAENDIVIISASPFFLLSPICKEIKCTKLIASNVEINTGIFNSDNCYGEEKVKRLNKEVKNYKIINFFSDSKSDIYLARLSKNSYLVRGRKIEKWKII